MFRFFLPALSLLILLAVGCRREEDFSTLGELRFSSDTLAFDTLFYNTLSPTGRLRVYNNSSGGVRISEIRIAGGEDSPFRLTVDGVRAQFHSDYELRDKDSIYLFMELTAEQNNSHRLVSDELVFRIGDREQRVPLNAWVLNAILFRDSTISTQNYTFPADTLILVDGYIAIDSGITATIPAGAKFYFTSQRDALYQPFSQIAVFGTLRVMGQPSNPVLFTNSRLDEDWKARPGEWRGIRFFKSSLNNEINWAIVQNAAVGIQADTFGVQGTAPKLTLRNTIVRHMSYYGIYGLGLNENIDTSTTNPGSYSIVAENVLSYNCGVNVAACFFGGRYAFTNCTFADNQWNQQRGSTVFAFTDVQRDGNGVVMGQYPGSLQLVNCIVWGNNDNELGLDVISPNTELALERNLFKVVPEVLPTELNGNRHNADPRFVNASDFNELDFHIREESPARDSARADIAPPFDLNNLGRVGLPDMGAYEYRPD